jgi:predicted dehydrogenase
MATDHVAALARVPEAEVVAMCDVVPGQVEQVPEAVRELLAARGSDAQVPRPAAYTDYAGMLARERLDAVYVCLPPAIRGEVEAALIRAGVAMLVEKPVALQLPLAGRILSEIRERGTIAASGYLYRYASWARRARELIGDRAIGQVMSSRFARIPSRAGWYPHQSQSGGQLTETMTHQVDLLRLLAGEVRTVFGAGAVRREGTGGRDDIFDVQSVALIFESGAVGTVACNLLSPMRHQWQVRVACDGFDLSMGHEMRLRAVDADGETEEAMAGDPLLEESAGFVRAVEQGRPEAVLSTYENGVRTLAVTLAADRSERTGVPVDVPTLLREEAGID